MARASSIARGDLPRACPSPLFASSRSAADARRIWTKSSSPARRCRLGQTPCSSALAMRRHFLPAAWAVNCEGSAVADSRGGRCHLRTRPGHQERTRLKSVSSWRHGIWERTNGASGSLGTRTACRQLAEHLQETVAAARVEFILGPLSLPGSSSIRCSVRMWAAKRLPA